MDNLVTALLQIRLIHIVVYQLLLSNFLLFSGFLLCLAKQVKFESGCTYITIKDVKKRWGKGQEDIYPVTQFEKLWGDMTALDELNCGYTVVPRMRGQQLKEVAQLDGWLRDGSAKYLIDLCEWV